MLVPLELREPREKLHSRAPTGLPAGVIMPTDPVTPCNEVDIRQRLLVGVEEAQALAERLAAMT